MTKAEKLIAHQKRWEIEVDEPTELQIFKNRLIMKLDHHKDIWDNDFWEGFHLEFNYFYGSKVLRESFPDDLLDLIRSSKDLTTLADYLQIVFIVSEDLEMNNDIYEIDAIDFVIGLIAEILHDTLDLSPQIPLSLSKTNDGIILYPKGASFLDDEIVNQNLLWLESHPNVLKHFEGVLIHYMQGDKRKYRNLLDDLRFALEQLLKSILKNKKSLENQKNELNEWLEKQGAHKQTINMYFSLLFGKYSYFQNDGVKHGEEFTENDIEFMIYLTGTFMRLLLQLEQKALKS